MSSQLFMRMAYRMMFALGLMVASQAEFASGQSSRSSTETIELVSPKVVKIFGAGGIAKLHSYGTGFLISPQGHILTVWSHVLDGEGVAAVLADGRRFPIKVVGTEPQLDLAVLKIDGENLPYFDLATAVPAGMGTRVLGFSNMYKIANGDEPVSVLHGVISARTTLKARKGTYESPYQGPVYMIDAITNNPGAGGGVLTTTDGRLLGMIGKELRNSQTNTWLNYVIPISEIREITGQILTGKFVSKPKDDLDSPDDRPQRYQALEFGLVMIPDVVYRTPAYIDRVLPGSAADQAGLKPNDLVLFFGEELVQSVRMLREEFGRLESGGKLRLVVRRNDQLIAVELPVPRKPDAK